MGLSASVVWEVRPSSGSDNNGGGFDNSVGSPGTDYSQQNSAQIVYSDLVIGATNTQLTSAGNPFGSADVGNIIQVTGGSGFTTGFYTVTSVSGTTATMDRAVGTANSTGGTGNLGGALASLGKLFTSSSGTTIPVQGNVVWITGTLTITSTINVTKASSGNFERIVIEGYSSSRGDGGKATITTATNSTVIFTLGGLGIELRNLSLTTTAGTKAAGIIANSSSGNNAGEQITIRDCTINGFTIGIDDYNGGYLFPLVIHNTTIENCSSQGVYIGNVCVMIGCYIYNNTSDGVALVSFGQLVAINCVSSSNGGCGFNDQGTDDNRTVILKQCVIYNNTSDGVKLNQNANVQSLVSINGIYYNNGGYGINGPGVETAAAPFTQLLQLNNAFGANSSGARNTGVPSDTSDISLSANPFNNAGSGDFSLNSTAGGGAACNGAGWQSPII